MKAAFKIAIAALVLAGCSNQPMTSEQQALMMQMMQNNQAAQSNLNAAILAGAPRRNAPTNCITSYASGSAYTTCQ